MSTDDASERSPRVACDSGIDCPHVEHVDTTHHVSEYAICSTSVYECQHDDCNFKHWTGVDHPRLENFV